MSKTQRNQPPEEDFPATTGPTDAASEAAAAEVFEFGEAEIARLRADLDDASDRVLRAQAELDNYRKRVHRELEDERRYASLPLLSDLLPVLDNLHRAIEAAEKADTGAALLDGVRLVAQTMESVLARHKCIKIEAQGKPFDPRYHQAISQQATDAYPPGTVVLVVQNGYTLYERVVRPAQVIVSTAETQEAASA